MILKGEGQYNLNILKEIATTDSFMTLDQNARKCQNIESFEDCTSKCLMKSYKQKCKCIPLEIDLTDHSERDEICYKQEQFECMKQISPRNCTSCIR